MKVELILENWRRFIREGDDQERLRKLRALDAEDPSLPDPAKEKIRRGYITPPWQFKFEYISRAYEASVGSLVDFTKEHPENDMPKQNLEAVKEWLELVGREEYEKAMELEARLKPNIHAGPNVPTTATKHPIYIAARSLAYATADTAPSAAAHAIAWVGKLKGKDFDTTMSDEQDWQSQRWNELRLVRGTRNLTGLSEVGKPNANAIKGFIEDYVRYEEYGGNVDSMENHRRKIGDREFDVLVAELFMDFMEYEGATLETLESNHPGITDYIRSLGIQV